MAEVLAPLRARYVDWLRLPVEQTAEDANPALVRAMPVILRVERSLPPARTPLLEAAASAAVAVCLDDRSAPGGEWHDEVLAWVTRQIRKVARRARGTHWDAVRELPGVTVTVGDGNAGGAASARALVPGLVSQTPRIVTRLQIAGTDLPPDSPGQPPPGVPVVWLNPGLGLTVGKAAAQVGHATMIMAAMLPATELAAWRAAGLRCAVRTASPDRWLSILAEADGGASRTTVLVRDAGFTEVSPGTITCAARWIGG